MLRIKGVIAFLILFSFLTVFSFFFLDNLLCRQLVSISESLHGAKVDIRHSRVSFSPFGLRLGGIEVADPDHPMQNIFELEHLTILIDLSALLRKKLIIETLSADGFQRNTQRRYSGALPKNPSVTRKHPKRTMPTHTQKDALQFFTTLFSQAADVDVSGLFDDQPLSMNTRTQSIRHSMKQDYQRSFTQLKHDPDFEKAFADIQHRFSSFGFKTSNLIAIQASFDELNTLKENTQKLRQQLAHKKKTLKTLNDSYYTQILDLDNAFTKDLRTVLARSPLTQYKTASFSQQFLKTPLEIRLQRYVDYYTKIMSFIPQKSARPSPLSSPNVSNRRRNRIITFPNQHPLPGFWLKTFSFRQQSNTEHIHVDVRDLCSDQDKIQRPCRSRFDYKKGSYSSLIKATLDQQEDDRILTLIFSHRGLPISGQIYQSALLDIDGSVRIDDAELNGQIRLQASHLRFDPPLLKHPLSTVFLSGLKAPKIDLTLDGTLSSPDIILSSDIDRHFSAAFRSYLSAKEAKMRASIRAQLQRELTSNKTLLSKDLQGQHQQMSRLIDADIARVSAFQKRLRDQESSLRDAKKRLTAAADRLKRKASEDAQKRKATAEEKINSSLNNQLKKLF
ncbi:MAG: TIGR03545 family protein [bacterium]